MKNIKIIIALVVVAGLTACGKKRKPQLQYMPDMYVSVPYDANSYKGAGGKPVNRKPVAGTIKRGGFESFGYADTPQGYELAKAELKSPIAVNEDNLANGKKMYDIYCAVCHGETGDGNGILPQRDKFNGVPNYRDREMTEGSIYYVIMHGRNLMGSHASQLTPKERWQVTQYVQKLRNDLIK